MGTILASEIIDQVGEVLQDETNLTWTEVQLLAWLNEALFQLVSERPDANIVRRTVALVSGTRQTVSGTRLHAVLRNMGASGATPGAALRLVSKADKDAFNPDWHSADEATAVREYMYDLQNPTYYYVSPPVSASIAVHVELDQFENPTELTATTDAIPIDDSWAPALKEWMLFRCTERDSEDVPQLGRQNTHFQRFYAMLGRKTQVDAAVSAKPEKAA